MIFLKENSGAATRKRQIKNQEKQLDRERKGRLGGS
jgi:hypothetical protein